MNSEPKIAKLQSPRPIEIDGNTLTIRKDGEIGVYDLSTKEAKHAYIKATRKPEGSIVKMNGKEYYVGKNGEYRRIKKSSY